MSLDDVQTARWELKAAQDHSFAQSKRLFQTIKHNLDNQAETYGVSLDQLGLSVPETLDEFGQLNGTAHLFGHNVSIKIQSRASYAFKVTVDGSDLGMIDGNNADGISRIIHKVCEVATDHFDQAKRQLSE